MCIGSPFRFHVDSLSSGYVTAYGPGLTHGVCGEPSNFTISTKGAGAGTYLALSKYLTVLNLNRCYSCQYTTSLIIHVVNQNTGFMSYKAFN
jgi:hypothetical protein